MRSQDLHFEVRPRSGRGEREILDLISELAVEVRTEDERPGLAIMDLGGGTELVAELRIDIEGGRESALIFLRVSGMDPSPLLSERLDRQSNIVGAVGTGLRCVGLCRSTRLRRVSLSLVQSRGKTTQLSGRTEGV